ncbi:SDR family NAD(P)-dependent oxidoreductase [Bacillus mesophilum]|uniref:SDR family oxidoreductase n=1 Tax=Bacillus mesophilum TaxID=1071718 RepID=A0A7V7RKB7_9BACI|nr:glucose 1-dehydrogenase [Bacillus mesophilum]KAB2331714.1 SDR family oxidoreductase [Bacillus mesophilum]
MGRLTGKVAIITGAAQGMGAEHVRNFINEGAKVAITDINEAAAKQLAEEMGENATYFKLDVSNSDDWKNAVEKTEELFGPINVLVNNAGVGIFKPLEDLTEEDFKLTFKIDELGVFLGMKAVLPSMKKEKMGSIINISSVSGLVGAPTGVAYNASKHAVTGMTKGAAADLGQYGIRVNSVHPGTIETPLAAQGDVADYVNELVKGVPLRRAGKVEEVSKMVVFLASDDSSYCTGSQFVVDGGMIADL